MTDSYLSPSRPNRTGIVVVVALHGAVLGALLLHQAQMIPGDPFKPMTIEQIPFTPPPPPLPEAQPRPRATQRPQQVVTPVPQVRVANTAPTIETTGIIPVDTPPPLPEGPPVAGERGPVVQLPPPLPPAPFVDAVPDPRFAADFQPPYPVRLEREGTEGVAVVRVLIGADGRVKDAQPVRADQSAFMEATLRQARTRWRFRPATRGAERVETWRTLTVRFVLPE